MDHSVQNSKGYMLFSPTFEEVYLSVLILLMKMRFGSSTRCFIRLTGLLFILLNQPSSLLLSNHWWKKLGSQKVPSQEICVPGGKLWQLEEHLPFFVLMKTWKELQTIDPLPQKLTFFHALLNNLCRLLKAWSINGMYITWPSTSLTYSSICQ